MQLTLKDAASEVGKSKSTLWRQIKKGSLSASLDNDGKTYLIDPSELFRVYPQQKKSSETLQKDNMKPPATDNETVETSKLYHENEMLRYRLAITKEERNRERAQLERTIEDLRDRLTEGTSERKLLTRLLTDEHQEKKTGTKTNLWKWFS